MVKVTFEFGTSAEAAAFLAGGKAAPAKKKTAKADDLGDDLDESGLEDETDDLEDEFAEAPVVEETTKVKIQKRAAALAAAGKKDNVTALVKKVKAKNLSGIPVALEEKFLTALMKIAL